MPIVIPPNLLSQINQHATYGDDMSTVVREIVQHGDATLTFRPGATGDNAPGGSVFTDFAKLMDVLKRTRHRGNRTIVFDNRFAPNPATDPVLAPFLAYNTPLAAQNGLYPCAIPPPPAGEAWDFTDVIWSDRVSAPGGISMSVQIWDGGPGRPCLIDNLKRIDMLLCHIVYNGKTVGNHPIISSRSRTGGNGAHGIQASGGRCRIFNTAADAQPLWLADIPFAATTGDPNLQFVNLRNDAQLGNDAALPAPLIELVTGCQFFCFGLGMFMVHDNCWKGPAGSTVIMRVSASAQNGNVTTITNNHPNFLGDFQMRWSLNSQRWRASTILTANGNAFHGDVCQVNTTSAAVRVTLPRAGVVAPSTGTSPYIGSAVTVLDVGGNAAVNNITIRAQSGESINGLTEAGAGESDKVINAAYGSLRFWNDGTGKWFVIT